MKVWQTIESPMIRTLTAPLAKEFVTMTPCPNDRPLRPKRLEKLKNIIDEDLFRTCEWCSVYVEETKTIYRVNGKHTSTTFSKMFEDKNGNVKRLLGIRILVTRYKVKLLEDAAKLYASFDSQISSRTMPDIIRVYKDCEPSLLSIPPRVAQLAVSAMSYAIYGSGAQAKPQDVRAHLVLEHPDFVVWLNKVHMGGTSADRKMLVRWSVASAMFQTWRKAPFKAGEFWSMVRDGTDKEPSSPSRQLNKFLMRSAAALGMGTRGTKNLVSPREMYDKCIHAWNAWRAGKTTLFLKYVPGADSPTAR